MTAELNERLAQLRARVQQLAQQNYRADEGPAVERLAAAAGDSAYFLARLRLLEAERDAAALHVHWMSPTQASTPKEALLRIKALCGYWPDLYEAMQAVLATHPLVARDILAKAIKQFRRDTEAYSVEDLTGLLISAWNGGRHGFEAVLRTRKTAERKAASVPWGRADD